MKIFLMLFTVMYLNQKNILSNQINNVERNDYFRLKKAKKMIS